MMNKNHVFLLVVSYCFILSSVHAKWTLEQEEAVSKAISGKAVAVNALPKDGEQDDRSQLSYAAQVLGDLYLRENNLSEAAAAYALAVSLGNQDVRLFLQQYHWSGTDTVEAITSALQTSSV